MHERDRKALACALVSTGSSIRSAAREAAVSEASVRRWLPAVERRETAQEKELGENVDAIAERIAAKQDLLREHLLDRMFEAAEDANLRDLGVCYGILCDKVALATHEKHEKLGFDADVTELSDEELQRTLDLWEAPLQTAELNEPESHAAGEPG